MFKLLTEEERKKVRHEYVTRRTIVMVSAFISVLVVGIIGLLPSYVLSNARQNEVTERAKTTGATGLEEEDIALEAWLTKINNELRILSPKLDIDRPTDFIEKILEEKIPGVRLTGFTWKKAEVGVALSVSGVASTRQSLISFENNIRSSGHFSDVNLPLSNLAGDRDISFKINFSFATNNPQTP